MALKLLTAPFAAAQAAQKTSVSPTTAWAGFAAAQAAQKTTSAPGPSSATFAAAQAAQKLGWLNLRH